MGLIPYGRQEISEEDIEAVVQVLRSDFLTQGPKIPAFEQAISNLVGASYCVSTCNATSALHVACLALGVGKGDAVWTSAVTFVASANCALYCGAQIDFVDIDLDTFNLSIDALRIKLEHAKLTGSLPKVVIPVHMAGQSCDMFAIYQLSQEYGFSIIEDASHAIGGSYHGDYVGSCKYSDITIFSFHPVKIITTGEGGAAVTNHKELASKMQLLRSHGITRDLNEMVHPSDSSWYYEQIHLGFNYRMTDIQAALGLSQMKRLNEFVDIRNVLAKRYDEMLFGELLFLPKIKESIRSSYHLYVIQLNLGKIQKPQKEIFLNLKKSGIGVNLHYIPVYLQPFYQNLGFKLGYCPNAEEYYSRAISIPLYSSLTFQQQDYVVEKIKENIQ